MILLIFLHATQDVRNERNLQNAPYADLLVHFNNSHTFVDSKTTQIFIDQIDILAIVNEIMYVYVRYPSLAQSLYMVQCILLQYIIVCTT